MKKRKFVIVLTLALTMLLGSVPVLASDTSTCDEYFALCDDKAVEQWGESFLEDNPYHCYLIIGSFYYGVYSAEPCVISWVSNEVRFGTGYIVRYYNGNLYCSSDSYIPITSSTDSSVVESCKDYFASSNYDVYYSNDNSLFFQLALSPTIAPIVGTVKTTEVMTELIGVVPLVVGLVVSYLGLRKGLRTLRSHLQKA